jgi:acyl dehydratase
VHSGTYSGEMQTFENTLALAALVGTDVATSPWHTITQEQIQRFADATGDQQWIHTDPQRAAAGPFGVPIAHGFLTLSLVPLWLEGAVSVGAVRMGVNYGLNKVRFTSPVPVNSRLRAHFHLQACEQMPDKGWQLCWRVRVEREGEAKPACVAEFLALQYE